MGDHVLNNALVSFPISRQLEEDMSRCSMQPMGGALHVPGIYGMLNAGIYRVHQVGLT